MKILQAFGLRLRSPGIVRGQLFEGYLETRGHGLFDLSRPQKTVCGRCDTVHRSHYDKKLRRIRDLSCGDARVYLEVEVRRVFCQGCGSVKRERLFKRCWYQAIVIYKSFNQFLCPQRGPKIHWRSKQYEKKKGCSQGCCIPSLETQASQTISVPIFL